MSRERRESSMAFSATGSIGVIDKTQQKPLSIAKEGDYSSLPEKFGRKPIRSLK